MTYSRDGSSLKEFRAICPVSRFKETVSRAAAAMLS